LELDCSNNHLIFVHFEKEGFTQWDFLHSLISNPLVLLHLDSEL
jgi:hypothetical protein